MNVELNGDSLAKAEVLKINSSLAKIHFDNANRFEWIHLGSPRFSTIYRNLVKQKLLDNIIDIKKYNACLSASHDVVVVDLIELDDETAPEASTNDSNGHAQSTLSNLNVKPNQPTKHSCGPSCLDPDESEIDIEKYSAFQRPLLLNWERVGWQRGAGAKKRFYRAPCGVELYSYGAIEDYLIKTDSKLRIDCFVLDAKIMVEKSIHSEADRIIVSN